MARTDAIYPIILAAGASSRLGFPKALARFGERTALQIAIDNCTSLEPPIVVLGSRSQELKKIVPRGVRVIVNPRWRSGQLSSLLAALRKVPRGAAFMLYPVDYPLLTPDIVASIVTGFRQREERQAIAVPSFRRRGGHPVIFSGALRKEFVSAETAREVVYRDPQRVKFIAVRSEAIWQDMDTPAAYQARLREFERRSRKRRVKAVPANRRTDVSASLRSMLAEIRDGLPVTREVACALIACDNDVLPDLLATAVRLKERFKPGVITYSRKVFIPLTNLCRDYCGYCIFRRDPGQPGAHTMSPEEVLKVARDGERLGCTEALFSLGDKPELAFPEMRASLRKLGYKSTLQYLEAMCELVLRQTSLIPHANPGLMSAEWLRRLRGVSPSLGLMLETTSAALLRRRSAHDNAPDKAPARRLRVIEEAGKQRIPFTTGILVGIGETPADRVESLFALAELHRRHGHIQEVIVQNFRAKPGIPMSDAPEPAMGDMLRTTAVARLVLRNMNVQAPPNLSAPRYDRLLAAGINDWGGVSPLTPDFINPERPWPHLQDLEARTRAAGYRLRQRLPVYPEFMETVAKAGGLAADKTLAAADAEGYAQTLGEDMENDIAAVLKATSTASRERAVRSSS